MSSPPLPGPRTLLRVVATIAISFAVPAVALLLSVGHRPPTAEDYLTSDLAWYFVPTFAVLHRTLTDGFLPLWNPWQLAGLPFLGAFQTQAAYAPAWAVAWLPPHLAVTTYNVLHWAWAFAGMMTLAGTLGVGAAGAIAASLAYTVSSPLVSAFFVHSATLALLSWFPWNAVAVLGVLRADRGSAARAVAMLAATLAMALVSGAPEHFMYMVGGLVVVAVWQLPGIARQHRARVLSRLAIAAAVAGLLGAVQILPAVEAMGRAIRTSGGFDRADIASYPVQTLALAKAVAGLSGGAGATSVLFVPLSIIALAAARTRRASAFLLFAGLFVLDHLRGNAGFVFPFLYEWAPFFRAFRVHLRAEFVWTMLASLVIALGVDGIARRLGPGDRVGRGALVLLLVLMSVELGGRLLVDRSFVLLEDPSAFYGGSELVDALADAPGPERLFVHYRVPHEGLQQKLGDMHAVRDVADYDALVPERYARLFRIPEGAVWMGRLQFLEARKAAAGRSLPVPAVDPADLDLLSTRYYLTRSGEWTSWILSHTRGVVRHRGVFDVIERSNARPRAYLVHEAIEAGSDEEALAALRSPTFDPARAAVVTGRAPALQPASGTEEPKPQVTIDEPNRVVVEAACSGRCLLVLTDLEFPGWDATVDGVPSPILTANYLVRGIVLEDGRHEIAFAYRPRPAMIGAAISIVTLAGLLVVLALSRR